MKTITKVLCTLGAAASLFGCSFGFESSEKVNDDIYQIYTKYQSNGGDLTYSEWLDSIKGEKGDKGDKGDTGSAGSDGEDGLTPYIGENGNWWIGDTDTGVNASGNKGDQGEKGDTGEKGDKGDQGEKGDTGSAGSDGEDGLTPYIGENGNWWIGDTDTGVNASGNKGDQGEKGDTGEKGDKGDQGEKGDTGTAGSDGEDGLSAYEIFVKNNSDYPYDEETWIYDLSHGKLGEHTLTLDPNGGTLQEGYETSYSNLHYYSALKLILPSATKNKYVFEGWYNEADGSRIGGEGEEYNFYLSSDMTITAHWSYVGIEGEKPSILNPSTSFNFDHSLIVEDAALYTYEDDPDRDGIMITGFSEDYDHQTYLSIPDQIEGKNVTKINHRAFWQKQTFSYISIPQYCVEIGMLSFCETYLKEVDFSRATNLEYIDDDSFSTSQICKLTGLSELDNLKKLCSGCFYGNKLQSFELNGNKKLEYLGDSCIQNNPLESVYLIDLPKLTYVGAWFAAYTSVKEVKLNYCPSFTGNFGQNSFASCSKLKTIDFSYNENLESLGAFVCAGNESLKTIYLLGVPKLKEVHGACATFNEDRYVEDIYYGGTKEQWEAISGIEMTNGNKYLLMARMHYGSAKITYKDGTFVAGQTKQSPSTLSYQLNSEGTGYIVTGIGTFEGDTLFIGGEYNNLPIVEIGANAFRYVDTLSDVFIGESITKIGQQAFQHIKTTTNFYFCSTTVPTFVSDTFGYAWGTNTFNIYCPEESYEDYCAVTSDPYWQQYAIASLKAADLSSVFLDRFEDSFEIVEKSVGTMSLPTLVVEGYTFEGWYYDEEFTNPVEGDITVSDDVVIYAKWTKNA